MLLHKDRSNSKTLIHHWQKQLPCNQHFNEFYAKDTSRKIRAVFKAKGNSGRPLTTVPPYGYLKDPEDKYHWIIDEEAAPVVKLMFDLCVAGYGPSQISKELMRRGIPTPTEHFEAIGVKVAARKSEQPGFWQQRTIVDLLEKPEYLGHTVNFRSHKKSFKCKKKVMNDPSEWAVLRTLTKLSLIRRPLTLCSVSVTGAGD